MVSLALLFNCSVHSRMPLVEFLKVLFTQGLWNHNSLTSMVDDQLISDWKVSLSLWGYALGLCWLAIRNEMGNLLQRRICNSVFLKLDHTRWRNWCKGQDVNLLISIWIRIFINVGVRQSVCDVKFSLFLVEKTLSHTSEVEIALAYAEDERGWVERLVHDGCERLVIGPDGV